MKLVLVNDTEGRVNIGCNLTSATIKEALVRAFSEQGCRAIIGSAPYLFGKNKTKLKAFWRKNSLFLNNLLEGRLEGGDKQHLRRLALLEYGEDAVSSALTADCVVFQPEGTLSDDTSFGKVAGFFSLPYLCIINGIKVAIINGTVPEYSGPKRLFVDIVFSKAFHLTFRDRLSALAYKGLYIPDAAFGYKATSIGDVRCNVLITTGARNTAEQDERIIDSALDFCMSHNYRPLVLTKKSDNFLSRKDDVLGLGGEFLETADLSRVNELLNGCVLHFGGRYHMAIFSLLVGVPSVLHDIKTHKNKWLADEFVDIEINSEFPDIHEQAARLIGRARQNNWAISTDVLLAGELFEKGIRDFVRVYMQHADGGGLTRAFNRLLKFWRA